MNSTSRSTRLVRSAARSPALAITGPEVARKLTPSSRARICASSRLAREFYFDDAIVKRGSGEENDSAGIRRGHGVNALASLVCGRFDGHSVRLESLGGIQRKGLPREQAGKGQTGGENDCGSFGHSEHGGDYSTDLGGAGRLV